MFPILPLIKPLGTYLITAVLKQVFKSEFKWGSGKGAEKLDEVVGAVSSAIDYEGFDVEPEELKRLTNAVVDVLNVVGMFDDEPGLDFSDFAGIFVAVKELAEAVADLVD